VRDFKSSWKSGEVFLAILCSLRPDLVDLSQAQTSSHLENLEKAFHLAEKELGIPRLLEPEGEHYYCKTSSIPVCPSPKCHPQSLLPSFESTLCIGCWIIVCCEVCSFKLESAMGMNVDL